MVLRAGIEPARPQGTQDFLTNYDFCRPQKNAVCGLDFTFTFYYFGSSQAGAVKSLHFSEKSDLARYCHFKGFTEFDSIHTEDFASDAQTS
jgi:hypothetical protein